MSDNQRKITLSKEVELVSRETYSHQIAALMKRLKLWIGQPWVLWPAYDLP